MSDDERTDDVQVEETREEPRKSSVSGGDDRFHDESGKSEAQLKMESEMKRRKEKAEEEWKEYEELRRAEKEKEAEEIKQLRERREKRRKEREAEEKRLAEQRAIEEQKRRAEEEERQRKKREEAEKKREERERKRQEAEERNQKGNRPNFIINKRASEEGTAEGDEPTKEEVSKSKEQLEAERKAILEQRIQPLTIDGFDLGKLKEKAKELHNMIYKLESEKYDLEQQFQRQNIDLLELAERARQMNKGGKTGQKVNMAQSDNLPSKLSRAPPKIIMYSQYERVKDPRSFTDRKDLYAGEMYSELYQRINPKYKVQMGEQGAEIVGDAEGVDDVPPPPAGDEAVEAEA